MNPTDPAARAAFITGLYQLADYLAENAGIPVPAYGTTILVPLGEQDDGTRAEIDYVAAEYLWPVRDEDGCYETHRDFGPIGYTIYALTKAFRDRHSPRIPTGDPSTRTRRSAMPDPAWDSRSRLAAGRILRHRQPVPEAQASTRAVPRAVAGRICPADVHPPQPGEIWAADARHHGRLQRPLAVVAMTTETPLDCYKVLGIARDATLRQVKAAYRKLAKRHHPDACPGDPEAAARFRDITDAYTILSDPVLRQVYDRDRHSPAPGTDITAPGESPGC